MKRIVIEWPLTPFTGWGSYGIQLAQALAEQPGLEAALMYSSNITEHCDLAWQGYCRYLEDRNAGLIRAQQSLSKGGVLNTNADLALSALGNVATPPRCQAKRQAAVTFFERSALDPGYIQRLAPYELVVTGSHWNQQVLERSGFQKGLMIHQGVDCSRFNPTPIPRLFQRPLVVFSGGKLEARKGQDLVLRAFQRVLEQIPDALLIACWSNVGNVGLGTIADCDGIVGAPDQGSDQALRDWLAANGLPERNVYVPPLLVNAQIPALIKQADAAVFLSRCEGGTNLMAMESLACAVPTLISSNTGHLDLQAMAMDHCVALPRSEQPVQGDYLKGYGGDPAGDWGETDPEAVAQQLMAIAADREGWRQRGQRGAASMPDLSWRRSMARLLETLQERELI